MPSLPTTITQASVSWQIELPVEGRCQDCGDDIGTAVRIWAGREWIRRYQSEDRLRRSVDRSVARMVVERHARTCVARTRRAS
jgi:hypothetical protein